MPDDLLKTVLLPLALILLMVGMGMSLTVADFRRVLFAPKATLVGVFLQLVMLPVLAFGLVYLFKLPGELAVGLMLVAACPGGPTSNLISHLSKGDTALSVTLTAVSSVVTVFTIPLVVGFAMERFMAGEAAIELPFGKTLVQLMVVTVIPIAVGMWIHAARPGFSQRMSKPVNVMSMVFLALIIIAAVLKEKDLGAQIAAVGPAVVVLNLGGMVLGFVAAGLMGLVKAQRIAISIEVGIQNGTLALAIALGLLESAGLAVPAVVYSLFMFVSGAVMIGWFGRGKTTVP
ncbi:bile acid:sodium symporter family protein [Phragmitibacter flavus]|uniref:Bile acid:sodium symporter family protein n=1 Tax=Phragmitibacter flavus TaxID=2576071 RepID=A0A5R8KKR7_9BACT|nr:bile acid:sodium symporter family protein [Phragmitibacter flavus]TLD72831.1 bile acid:sodium symporter family protein [Phragmitibacter flavus]